MAESMQGLHRTCRCAEVTKEMIGKEVVLMGWVQKARDKGGIIFVDLRDRSGIMQLIFEISMDEFGGSVGGGGRYDEMIGKFTGNNTSACGFSIGFERIVMLLLERNYEIPTKNGKKAYLIEKNMPADKLLTILKQAQEERNAGTQINISIMKKNKKFQKDQMTAEGYTEFVEFFKDRV